MWEFVCYFRQEKLREEVKVAMSTSWVDWEAEWGLVEVLNELRIREEEATKKKDKGPKYALKDDGDD